LKFLLPIDEAKILVDFKEQQQSGKLVDERAFQT
jgi:hypothetical protein